MAYRNTLVTRTATDNFFGPSYLASTALHLHDAGEIVGDVLRYELDIGGFSVAIMRDGADTGPRACRKAIVAELTTSIAALCAAQPRAVPVPVAAGISC